MGALLVAKFPERFLEEKVIPALEERHIWVDRIVCPDRFSTVRMNLYDSILIMTDRVSHSFFYSLRDRAKSEGIPFFNITRKSASWNESEFKRIAATMRPKAISDLPGFFAETEYLMKNGLSVREMTHYLKRFWANNKIPSAGALQQQLVNRESEAPDSWKKIHASWKRGFYERQSIPGPKKSTAHIHPSRSEIVVPATSEPVPPPPESRKSMPKRDEAELARIYSEENDLLKIQLAEMKSKITELESKKDLRGMGKRASFQPQFLSAQSRKDIVGVADAYKNMAKAALSAMEALDKFYKGLV